MKQILNDLKDEFEQNLNSAVNTVKSEPKKFFQSFKAGVTGNDNGGGDFGKILEKAAANQKSGNNNKFDPLASNKPMPSKKMFNHLSDVAVQKAKMELEQVRKRLEQIRNEKLNSEDKDKQILVGKEGSGPQIQASAKNDKRAIIEQTKKNALSTGELKSGGMG
jgi:hypothetical protein